MSSRNVGDSGQNNNGNRCEFTRCSRRNPCPVCGKPDWCYFIGTGVVCMRTENAKREKINGGAGEGWFHFLDGFVHRPSETVPNGKGAATPSTKKKDKPTLEELAARNAGYAKNFADGPKTGKLLATDLGLPESVFGQLPGIGATTDHWRGACWTFPERDTRGNLIGISLRLKDRDAKNRKVTDDGSTRGLTIPLGWKDRAGAIYLVEGVSCTLAMTAAGLAAIGRPSNTGGRALLAELIRAEVPAGRPVVWMGENDRKENGDWPGDTRSAAQEFAVMVNREILYALTPDGIKDCRDWLIDDRRLDMEWDQCGRELAEQITVISISLTPPGRQRGTPTSEKLAAAEPSEVEPTKKDNVAAEKPTDKELTDFLFDTNAGCASQSVIAGMYSEKPIHTSDHAPQPKTPPPKWPGIVARLASESRGAFCYRVNPVSMDCIAGRNAGWCGRARFRCKGLCCTACHIFYREDWAAHSAGLASGELGVHRTGTPLPVKHWSGTNKQWRALDAYLTRLEKTLNVEPHQWVCVKRDYHTDALELLIFGSPETPRLPDPAISRACAADIYATAVEEIVKLDQEEMRGKQFRPITSSEGFFPERPKKRDYALTLDNNGFLIRTETTTNAVRAEAALRSGAYEVEYNSDGLPAGKHFDVDHGGFFGERDRHLCAAEGLLDPTADDFLTCELPRTYPPPGWVPVQALPTECGGTGFSKFDDLEVPGGQASVPVREIEPVEPPKNGPVVRVGAVPDEVGPNLASAAKWVLDRLPAPPASVAEAHYRLKQFVWWAARVALGEMRKSIVAEIEEQIANLAKHVDRTTGALKNPDVPVVESERRTPLPGESVQSDRTSQTGKPPEVPKESETATLSSSPDECLPTPIVVNPDHREPDPEITPVSVSGASNSDPVVPTDPTAPATAGAEPDDALINRINREFVDLPPAWLDGFECDIRAAHGNPDRRALALETLRVRAAGWRAIPRGRPPTRDR